MSVIRSLVISSILTISLPITLAAETVRQHDAHEHGVSKLKIAIDKNKVQFVLEAPGADIVGFEHKAENADQKKSVVLVLDVLNKPGNLFELPLAAGCSLSSATSKLSFNEDDHQDGAAKHEEEESHAEFHATYSFTCSSPGALKTIGVRFFDLFPNAKEIELEAVSEFGQMAAEISNDMRSIDLSSIIQ
jgi:hypothetical protein